MEALMIKELDSAAVRKTGTGLYSVFDVLKLCGAKNPRETLKRIDAAYPETQCLAFCDTLSLPRSNGRPYPTPVATKEHLLIIIGLCPGKIGRAYRNYAANLVVRYLEADISLAESIVQRTTDVDGLKRLSLTVEQVIARLEAAGIPHGEIESRTETKLYEKDLAEGCKNNFYTDPDLGALFHRHLGVRVWHVDIDTPNYQDYLSWHKHYPKEGLPLEQAVEALKIIREGGVCK